MSLVYSAAAVLIGAAIVASPVPATAQSNNDLVFDYASRQWVKKRPKRLRRTVKAKYRRRTVAFTTRQKPGTIIIDPRRKYLYYVLPRRRAVRYGVGVGREGFTWSGEVKVQRKAKWPTWTPPPEMREREWRENKRRLPRVQKGGPDNPMGARALYLFKGRADTQYRIHGTNEPWSIGLNMSSGCIRLMNKDVEDLYERTRVGAKVVVIGPNTPRRRDIYSEFSNPLSFLFGRDS